jgi:hypothetical protein
MELIAVVDDMVRRALLTAPPLTELAHCFDILRRIRPVGRSETAKWLNRAIALALLLDRREEAAAFAAKCAGMRPSSTEEAAIDHVYCVGFNKPPEVVRARLTELEVSASIGVTCLPLSQLKGHRAALELAFYDGWRRILVLVGEDAILRLIAWPKPSPVFVTGVANLISDVGYVVDRAAYLELLRLYRTSDSLPQPLTLTPTAWWEGIDKVFYLNLKRRTDRRAHVEAELRRLGLPDSMVERYDAYEHRMGCYGASRTHIGVLVRGYERGYRRFLVVEDDFEANCSTGEFAARITRFMRRHADTFDVVMLTALVNGSSGGSSSKSSSSSSSSTVVIADKEDADLRLVRDASDAGGYLVQARFCPRLIECMAESAPKLLQTYRHWDFALDQAWKRLQRESNNWYVFEPRLARQRVLGSDTGIQHQGSGQKDAPSSMATDDRGWQELVESAVRACASRGSVPPILLRLLSKPDHKTS